MSEESMINAQSSIKEVTVYPDSAVIKRNAAITLEAGQHKILFADLIPDLNQDTLRVSAAGQGEIKIAAAQVKREYLPVESSERIRNLQEKLRKLADEKQQLENELKLRTEEKQFLDSFKAFANTQLPKEIVTKMPTGAEFTDTYQFYSAKLSENFTRTFETQIKLRSLKENIDALQKEYDEISSYSTKETRNIEVCVEALKPGAYEISVSFQVWGANWQPTYDARADFAAGRIELVSFGIVTQTTGEDWNDVEMYLSTAKPATSGQMPEITPWVLRPYIPRPARYSASCKSVGAVAAGPAPAPMAREAADFTLAEEESIRQETYSESEVKGTSVIYKLPMKVSVQSDGAEHKLPLSNQVLPAAFEYSTYPMAVLAAYLRSRSANAPDLQLLAGMVNIFLDGDYVGSSSINNIGPGEEFDLYLGMDENVKVKRDLIEKKANDKLLGSNRQVAYVYKLTIENYKTQKITVKLFEAVPTSEDAKIKVKIGQVSEEPSEKDWRDKKGIWLWNLELEPKAKQEIVLHYSVEYPREVIVEGLDN